MKETFGTERIDIPRAPGLGLVLDQVHFDRYYYYTNIRGLCMNHNKNLLMQTKQVYFHVKALKDIPFVSN
jgi:hypothetical protein